MKNYVSEGKCVTVRVNPNVYEVKSGDPLIVGHLFGIAATSVLRVDPSYPLGNAADERDFELYVQGVYELDSDQSQFKTGDPVYFDTNTRLVTATKPDLQKEDESTILIGVATESIKRSESKVRVRLNGISL